MITIISRKIFTSAVAIETEIKGKLRDYKPTMISDSLHAPMVPPILREREGPYGKALLNFYSALILTSVLRYCLVPIYRVLLGLGLVLFNY